jgi:uncharacterized membrane protein
LTIKDILNTPINEMWRAISPFAIGYLIFFCVVSVVVISFIIFVFIQIIKGHKELNRMKNERMKRKW